MVILELAKLSADSKVVIEGCLLDPWLVRRLTEQNLNVFPYADEEMIKNGFFAREDKQDLLDIVNALSDPVKTCQHILEASCAAPAHTQAEAEVAGPKFLYETPKPIYRKH